MKKEKHLPEYLLLFTKSSNLHSGDHLQETFTLYYFEHWIYPRLKGMCITVNSLTFSFMERYNLSDISQHYVRRLRKTKQINRILNRLPTPIRVQSLWPFTSSFFNPPLLFSMSPTHTCLCQMSEIYKPQMCSVWHKQTCESLDTLPEQMVVKGSGTGCLTCCTTAPSGAETCCYVAYKTHP